MSGKTVVKLDSREDGTVRLLIADPLSLAVGARVAVKAKGAKKGVPGRFLRNFNESWIEFGQDDMPDAIASFDADTDGKGGAKLTVTIDVTDALPPELALQCVGFLSAAAGLVDPLGEVARTAAHIEMIARAHREHARKVARALLCWGTCLSYSEPADWKRAAAAASPEQPGYEVLRDVAAALAKDERAIDSAVEAGEGLIAGSVALRDASESKDVTDFAERVTFGARELLNGLKKWEELFPRRPAKRSPLR